MNHPIGHPINWRYVSDAIRCYQGFGYRYIEVPWLVQSESIRATLPSGKFAFSVCGDDLSPVPQTSPPHFGILVGSAEQSFIQMMLDGQLQPGLYCAATPCFRNEQDEIHQPTFFKVELIHVLKKEPTPAELQNPLEERMSNPVNSIAVHARWFFRSVAPGRDFKIVETPDGLDIELDGLELGSYGYRAFQGYHWIYGTGVAEPRLSMALRRGTK